MATIQSINIGTNANDNTGDTLRNAFDKTNQNNAAINNDLANKATIVNLALKAPLENPTFASDIIVNGFITVGRGGGNLGTNTVLGNGAGFENITGIENTSIGNNAANKNQNGSNNTAIGKDSLFFNQGNNNVAIGKSVMYSNIFGGENTYVGANAGLNQNGPTANSNTGIGYNAGLNNISFFNISCLGANAQPTASNQITLGDTGVTSLRCNVTSITSLSDERDKTDILEITEGLDFVSKLKPVTFTWNQRDGNRVGVKSAGFIAQDLLELQDESLIGENLDLVSENDPERLEARYANLLPVMIKAIQELTARINVLEGN
jgi:hypothetical protein